MSVEAFTKKQFEDALPKHKKTNAPLWVEVGLDRGEYAYSMRIKKGVHICIRSSVKKEGVSAGTGKDSIRAYLCDEYNKPLGSKINVFINRTKGWENRLKKVLRKLWERGLNIEVCPKCGKMKGVFEVKKEGKNKGRLFIACFDHFTETFKFI